MELEKLRQNKIEIKCCDCDAMIMKKAANHIRCLACSNKKAAKSKLKSKDYIHDCVGCKNSFISNFKSSKFCSMICKKIHANNKINKKWVQCSQS